jgi:hypothetical protein
MKRERAFKNKRKKTHTQKREITMRRAMCNKRSKNPEP